MKYSQSEPLARNIDRYVQLKYPFYMFDEKSFEIDDDGRPWWICPVQTRTIGLFGGTTIDRVVLVDAVTGECQDLAIEDCPQWVDRAYPSDLLIQQYNWQRHVRGRLAELLSSGQQGVVQHHAGHRRHAWATTTSRKTTTCGSTPASRRPLPTTPSSASCS